MAIQWFRLSRPGISLSCIRDKWYFVCFGRALSTLLWLINPLRSAGPAHSRAWEALLESFTLNEKFREGALHCSWLVGWLPGSLAAVRMIVPYDRMILFCASADLSTWAGQLLSCWKSGMETNERRIPPQLNLMRALAAALRPSIHESTAHLRIYMVRFFIWRSKFTNVSMRSGGTELNAALDYIIIDY